jgi:predicted RNA binding protein YcfA (HicA-like mRNA interferase family)
MKVWQIIGTVEGDGWQLVSTGGSHRQYKHAEKPGKVTIPCKRSDDLRPEDRREHPRAGRIGDDSDYSRMAESYLILVEGGPPSNYSAWSPDLPVCSER